MPRFVIGVRELYDRNPSARGRIDTGFGVRSQPIASENTVLSAIAFADVAPGHGRGRVEGNEDDELEAIRLEALGDGTHQV